jgi:Spy/CpxP family protein refolding chaperone
MQHLPARTLTMLLTATILLTGAVLPAGSLDLPPGTWWENPRLVDYIRLTKEQQERIGDLVYRHAQRMIDLNAGVEKAKLALENQVDQSELDPEAVRNSFAAFQKARHMLESERFEMLLSVRQILAPEQWERLTGLRERLDQSRQRQARPGGYPGRQDRRPPPGAGFR